MSAPNTPAETGHRRCARDLRGTRTAPRLLGRGSRAEPGAGALVGVGGQRELRHQQQASATSRTGRFIRPSGSGRCGRTARARAGAAPRVSVRAPHADQCQHPRPMAPTTSPLTRTSASLTRWMRAIMTRDCVAFGRPVRKIRGRFSAARSDRCRAWSFDRRARSVYVGGHGVGAGAGAHGDARHGQPSPTAASAATDRGLQERLSDVQRAEARGQNPDYLAVRCMAIATATART